MRTPYLGAGHLTTPVTRAAALHRAGLGLGPPTSQGGRGSGVWAPCVAAETQTRRGVLPEHCWKTARRSPCPRSFAERGDAAGCGPMPAGPEERAGPFPRGSPGFTLLGTCLSIRCKALGSSRRRVGGICSPVCPSSIRPFTTRLPRQPSVCPSGGPSARPPVCSHARPSIHPPIYRPSVRPSTHP